MKKYSVLVLLIVSLCVNGISVTKIMATDMSVLGIPSAMQDAYDEIILQRPDWTTPIEAFDMDVWNDYHVLVMDIPGTYPANLSTLKEPDGSTNRYNANVGEYRYIGKNPDGYLVNNPEYPDDHTGKAVINTYAWKKNDVEETKLYQYIKSPEDQVFYETEIFHFLEEEYGPRFDETDNAERWLVNAIVIVPVSSTGRGVIKYMHEWDSNKDGVLEDWYITVNLRSKSEAGFKQEEDIDDIGQVENVTESVTSDMSSQGQVIIQGDSRGNEAFDASVAIPTSENMYVQVQGKEYLFDKEYKQVQGTKSYNVTAVRTYRLTRGVEDKETGEVTERTKTVRRRKTYSVKRDYNFYIIQKLGVFALDKSVVENAALPNGAQTLESSVLEPRISMKRDTEIANHMIEPVTGSIEIKLPTRYLGSKSSVKYPSVPDEDFREEVEEAVGEIKVWNDTLVFNGETLMDGGTYEVKAPKPKEVPVAKKNSIDDLYRPGLKIEPKLANGLKPSKATLHYKTVIDTLGRTSYTEEVVDINDVTVHTPVVCYPVLSGITKETQQLAYDKKREQFVIGEYFHIDYPKTGQHLKEKGYGNREYGAYFEVKQVTFPFDVYVGSDYDGIYLPRNTWGNFNSLEATFFIPSWEREREGNIKFRSIPINIQDIKTDPYEYYANLDLTKYKAVDSIDFKLSSKVYDFKVIACPDDYWKHYVSKATPYTAKDLPIRPNDSRKTKTPKEGIMLGYPIEFEMMTNGDLYQPGDRVQIEPYYDYVPVINGVPDYSQRQAVDVYVSHYSQVKAFEGGFELDKKKRKFVGDGARGSQGINEELKRVSEQKWTGRFHLPNMSYFLPKGTDIYGLGSIDLGKEPFLHNGYIIVGFDIVVHKEGKKDYLSYKNGWTEEGFVEKQNSGTYRLGDVAIYSTSRRASQTYQ